MCHGEKLNAQAVAEDLRQWSKSEEIDQLIDVFLASGLTIGNKWFKADDADEYWYNSTIYEWWLQRAEASKWNDADVCIELMTEYAELKETSLREYVTQLHGKLTSYLEDLAS